MSDMARLLPSRESTGKQGFAQSAYHALNLLSWVSSRGGFSVERDSPGARRRSDRRTRIYRNRLGNEPTAQYYDFRLARLCWEGPMEEHQVGWIAAVIIGGIAGWLAEQFMKSQMGLLMNIVLGIIGDAVASWLFGFLGITFGGWIGYLIAGFIGACILIAIARAFSGGLQQRT